MKNKEKKALAIMALIIGILALVLSWVPLINNFAAILAFPAIILGVIALIVNRSNSKTLSVVSTAISILALIIVLVTQSMYSNAIENVSKSVDESISSNQKEADDKFTWTLKDYNALVTGESFTGVGGQTYSSIEETFGKPSNSSESSYGETSSKHATWNNMGSSSYKSINLTFYKQADGAWLLADKMQSGLE